MGAATIGQLVTTFHIGRSGSTVLGDLLDQHPAVTWLGEIYEWREFRDRPAPPGPGSELLRRLQTRLPAVATPVAGIEAKFYHLHDHRVPLGDFLAELRATGVARCRFIVLRRKNYLRKIVSSLAARQRGQWFARTGQAVPPARVEINPDRVCIDGDAQPLLDYLQDWDAQFDQLDAVLAGEEPLHLTYEDDIEQDPRVAYRKVCGYLGLTPGVPEVRFHRTTPQPLAEVVTTLPAVRQALAGTRYEWMVE
jgi:LPS sulfotransferase NodH